MTATRAARPPVAQRAGTPLIPEATVPVHGLVGGKKRRAGALDTAAGVYQTGGELSNFVYWAKKLVTLDMAAWNALRGRGVRRLEFIDHDKNQCWAVDYARAAKQGVAYQAGIGARWGIPLSAFDVTDADGRLVRRAAPPT